MLKVKTTLLTICSLTLPCPSFVTAEAQKKDNKEIDALNNIASRLAAK